MAKFQYQARNSVGQLISGELEAPAPTAVASWLLKDGLVPIDIKEAAKFRNLLGREFQLGRRLKEQDLAILCRQLYTMLKSGVLAIDALKQLLVSTKAPILLECLNGIIETISSGQTLTQAFAKYGNIFTPVVVSILEAGENSGQLDQAFLLIAEHLEFEVATSRRLIEVMRYPAMVGVAAFLALIILNYLVIPAFAKMFAVFNVALPWPTRILMASSNFFIAHWFLLIFLGSSTTILIWNYLNSSAGRLWWDEYKLRLPFIGEILQQIIFTRFAKIFALMLQTGVSVPQSLELLARVVGNTYIGAGVLGLKKGVERGSPIAKTAAELKIFSPLMVQILSTGEKTRSLDQLLLDIASYYEAETKYNLVRLSEIMLPVILAGLGGAVLILALGVFLPMWDMVQFTS